MTEGELMDFIARFGATASKAPQCQDRRKKLEKLRAAMLPPPTGEIRALAATVEAETATLKVQRIELLLTWHVRMASLNDDE